MRRGLAAHVESARLGLRDQLHALFGRNVTDMIFAAGFLNQREVSLHRPPLALGRDALVSMSAGVNTVVNVAAVTQGQIFTVRDDRQLQPPRDAHRLPHQRRVIQSHPVIAKTDDIGRHRRKICQPFALFAGGDGAVRPDINAGVFFDDGSLDVQIFQSIRHRVQIRHREDMSVTGGCRRHRAAQNRFLIKKSRLSQMYMHIHKRGDCQKWRCG